MNAYNPRNGFFLGEKVYAIPLDKILNLNATKKTSTCSHRLPPSRHYFWLRLILCRMPSLGLN